jgi:hypothetical protein
MPALAHISSALLLLLAAQAQDAPDLSQVPDFSLDVAIAMTGENDDIQTKWYGNTHVFAIDVTAADGETWRVMHRFNDFHALVSDLGVQADTLEGAPFAGRVAQPGQSKGDFVIERRKTLETWLRAVLKHPEIQGEWKPLLQKFLHKDAKAEAYLKDNVMTWLGGMVSDIKGKMGIEGKVEETPETEAPVLTDIDVVVSMSGASDSVEGATHIFAIDVTPTAGEVYQVMHRFNDFHQLKSKLGSLSEAIDGAPFPKAHKGFIPGMAEEYDTFLAARREGLAVWLQAVLKHRNANGDWKVPLAQFLTSVQPGEYLGDEAKKKFQEWSKTVGETLAKAKDSTAKFATQASEKIKAKYAEAKAALNSANELKEEFNEAETKFEDAVLKVKEAKEGGASESVVEEAEKKAEVAKSTLVEAGERAQEGIEKADELKEDLEDLQLEPPSTEKGDEL